MEVALQREKKRKDGCHKHAHDTEWRGEERLANLVSSFEYGEWIQHEADGDAGRGTRQKVSGICQYRENGGMTFGVALADR